MSKPYTIEFVRIEHNIYKDTVIANSKQEAMDIFLESINWDDYETVHADEYFEKIAELGDK
jgi:hypothetical protein